MVFKKKMSMTGIILLRLCKRDLLYDKSSEYQIDFLIYKIWKHKVSNEIWKNIK